MAALLAPPASASASKGKPDVELTTPTEQDRRVVLTGRNLDVSFTANRDWPYTLDVRAPETDEEWIRIGGVARADVGDNTARVRVPGTLTGGEYDVKLNLFTRHGNPDRHRPVATDTVTGALEIETRPGYISKIASGVIAGTSFEYLESPNTPQVVDRGPIEGHVTYVGGACDDDPPVPEASGTNKIALLERGGCTFVEKMANVLDGGWSVYLMFNSPTGNDGCDDFPSSMNTSASIPMLAIPRSAGLQLLGEADEGGIDCSDPPEVQAEIGTVGESVLIYAEFDPESMLTGFEQRNGRGWTEYDEEHAFLKAVDAASDRVTYSEVGTSIQGRSIHLVQVGEPEPPSDEVIADGRSMLVLGAQHGNEPAGREMALQLLRDLALTDDPTLTAQLEDTTVLVIPTVNPDGRVANTRGNADGVDTNRDHLHMETPEAETVAEVVRDYRPDITLDAHERPSGSSPDLEVLWPRNLNVDQQLHDLDVEMTQDYVQPDVEAAGFSTGLYGSPGGAGGEDERIARNVFGLRHGIGLLTESAGQDEPTYRVAAQMEAARATLRFLDERADDVDTVLAGAPDRKATAGANQSEPYYLGGADNWPPTDSQILDPPPCGYVINTTQAADIDRVTRLFEIETEQVSDNGVFITMGQPMMTVVPLLTDQRAAFHLAAGVPITDPATCADPSDVTPPGDAEPAEYATDFSDDQAGQPPEGWSMQWRDATWNVLDDPQRLQHTTPDGGRKALTWDEVGTVHGDVEISGLVRAPAAGAGGTMFQIGFHVSGTAGNENFYYLDARLPTATAGPPNHVTVNKYANGSYSMLDSAELPFTADTGSWYHVVLQREGTTMRAKMWPDGEDEPAEWQVTVDDSSFNSGMVGVAHVGSNVINDYAFIGVGTGGKAAPRAPDGLVPTPEPPTKVTGVTADQEYGFATVAWGAATGATEYEVERTPLVNGEPADSGEVVGRWTPTRHPAGDLTFADSGFTLGESYQWRVRGVTGDLVGEWSDPVNGDTAALLGPEPYLTEFELSGGADWTSHEGELALLEGIAADSDRVRLETIGETAQGRPLHLVTIGDPALDTPEEIADAPSVLNVCTIHGTEPAAREACLTLLRKLAFSDDPWVTDILAQSTILMIPTANPDGRAANERENAAGQDLNRDNLQLRHEESIAIAEVMRDYQPDLVVDGHEYQSAAASDLSSLWARSPNVGEPLWDLSQNDLVLGRLFPEARAAGWSTTQYPLTATGWEAQLQNTAGLKNRVNALVESRRRPGPTRPAEGDADTLVTTPENQMRRVYTQLWAFEDFLDYHSANIPEIQAAIEAAETAAAANEGPLYLDGMRDVPNTPPPNQPPTIVVDPPPCGYQLTTEQYNEVGDGISSIGDRLASHGVTVEQVEGGVVVPLSQPLRGLIPYVLDPRSPLAITDAEPLETCGT